MQNDGKKWVHHRCPRCGVTAKVLEKFARNVNCSDCLLTFKVIVPMDVLAQPEAR